MWDQIVWLQMFGGELCDTFSMAHNTQEFVQASVSQEMYFTSLFPRTRHPVCQHASLAALQHLCSSLSLSHSRQGTASPLPTPLSASCVWASQAQARFQRHTPSIRSTGTATARYMSGAGFQRRRPVSKTWQVKGM